jgi:threonine/homoserine/homoserine lactone efflux protein
MKKAGFILGGLLFICVASLKVLYYFTGPPAKNPILDIVCGILLLGAGIRLIFRGVKANQAK